MSRSADDHIIVVQNSLIRVRCELAVAAVYMRAMELPGWERILVAAEQVQTSMDEMSKISQEIIQRANIPPLPVPGPGR